MRTIGRWAFEWWPLTLMWCCILAGCAAGKSCQGPAPGVPERPPALPSGFLSPFFRGLGAVAHVAGDVPGQDYSVLTYAAGLCTLIAAGSALASAVWPGDLTRRLAGTAIATAVGLWVLRVLLVKYLWLAVLLSALAAIAFGVAFLWGHLWWFEEKTGLDLDKSGTVGRGGGHAGPGPAI